MRSTYKFIAACVIGLSIFSMTACVSTNTSESTGQYIDSAATTTKVKAALVNALGVASVTNIEVSTFKGVVQLSGFVNNQSMIAQAVSTARTVAGVVAVENSLIVKPQ